MYAGVTAALASYALDQDEELLMHAEAVRRMHPGSLEVSNRPVPVAAEDEMLVDVPG